MSSIKWTGGSLEAALQQTVYPQVRDNVDAKLRAVRCPVHGTTPTSVTIKGSSLDDLSWEAKGCCDKLVAAMRQAFQAE